VSSWTPTLTENGRIRTAVPPQDRRHCFGGHVSSRFIEDRYQHRVRHRRRQIHLYTLFCSVPSARPPGSIDLSDRSHGSLSLLTALITAWSSSYDAILQKLRPDGESTVAVIIYMPQVYSGCCCCD